MGLLREVNSAIQSEPNITVSGYYNTPAIYVNDQGVFYVYQSHIDQRVDPSIVQP